jgi:hypothetical protein
LASALPKEPVPPVIRIFLPLNISIDFQLGKISLR